MAGKGSRPRPLAVDAETFAANYARIFGAARASVAAQAAAMIDSAHPPAPEAAARVVAWPPDVTPSPAVRESWNRWLP